MRRVMALSLFSLLLTVSTLAFAATTMRPTEDHRWYSVMVDGLASAHAVRCQDCNADLLLRCMSRGRGLMELILPGASVSNGRVGSTKQIRLTFGDERLWRRAFTQWRSQSYTPVIELGVDDPVLNHLTAGGLLRISFYGQRSFVGLRGAAGPVGKAREICRPEGQRPSDRHCVWAAVIACSSDRFGAEAARNDVPHSFIRATSDGYCVTLASEGLATAKARADRYGGYVERSCIP